MKTLIKRTPNTDNKGKLFVTVFAPVPIAIGSYRDAPALLTMQNCRCTRTPASAQNKIHQYRDKLLLPDAFYRDTAPVPVYQHSFYRDSLLPLINLVPRHSENSIKFAP